MSQKPLYAAKDRFLTIAPSTPPRWGGMSPQHTVEHLIDTLFISNGKMAVPLIVGEDVSAASKNHLMGAGAFPKNYQNPLVTLRPLKAATYAAAVERMANEIDRFYQFFDENPDAKPMHPILGELSFEEWEAFHLKHFAHHQSQFID